MRAWSRFSGSWIVGLWSVLVLISPVRAFAKTQLVGDLFSSHWSVKVSGSVSLETSDEGPGPCVLQFSDQFRITSGVVLDVQLCGIPYEHRTEVCVSVGELRKLKGPYQMRALCTLYSFTRLRIVDIEFAQPHAEAALLPK